MMAKNSCAVCTQDFEMITNTTVPSELQKTDSNLVSIVAYSVVFVVAACGNLTVFITLFRNRHRKSRVNLFIIHLSIADLMVTFIVIPLEVSWHATVQWLAGDVACRIFMFWRTFGFYLSSFILIAISLDRYFAITHPMSLSDADRRGKLMLLLAWLFSIVASSPQSVIYHVENHPKHSWFKQCVTFNFFPSPTHELIYNVFSFTALYLAPLVVIIISYSCILIEITKRSREGRHGPDYLNRKQSTKSTMVSTGSLRRSGVGRMEKARIRTLKMTIVIVIVFVMCWSPYYAMLIWHWVDVKSAEKVNDKIQRILYLFAVSNSCMNPIVYGLFTRTVWVELRRCCCLLPKWISCKRTASRNPTSSPNNAHNNQTSSTQLNRWEIKNSNIELNCKNGHYKTALIRTEPSSNSQGDGESSALQPLQLVRKVTPPHIALGKGNTYRFENLLL